MDRALLAFQHCVKLDPKNANATYWLGMIAERQGDQGVSQVYFARTLSLDPQHGEAKTHIDVTAHNPIAHVPDAPKRTESQAYVAHEDLYAQLSRQATPMDLDTVAIIDRIAMDRRMRLSGFTGVFIGIWFIVLGLLIAVLLMVASYHPPRQSEPIGGLLENLTLVAIVVAIAASIIAAVSIRSIRYVFTRGYLIGSRGILSSIERKRELLHLQSAELSQSLLDKLTGNGRLKLTFESSGTKDVIEIRGLLPINELRTLRDDLYDLRRLLVTNPLTHGIATQ